ncbi:leucyl aminopeptidase [Microbacterium candidum]|uniref:Probable cytosol aminopeptidase n=1 Tax=Microbacterium candidum TaxID=3041922 RepID=A0ABT7MZ13_9MICO|nr:leucyl aminopeptidase [Microbacterium sp. ASV49]MDL9979698.1 leucyl aminopeptidase [Microbacterium sp. ASV49]
MPFPELARSSAPIRDSDADAILIALPPIDDEDREDAVPVEIPDWPGLAAALSAVGFTGASGSLVRVPLPDVTTPLAVVGTGADVDADGLREAVGAGIRQLTGFETVAVTVPLVEAPGRSAAEGAALGGYSFADYKTSEPKRRASRVVLHDASLTDDDLAAATVAASAVALVKDLGSTPAEWLSPAQLADRAVAEVEGLPVEVTVLDEAELEAQGFGGILGVGQGSDRPPRLVRLDYAPAGAERHVAVVGKGITFDTGGLSLKPPASMVGMKYDMCGAATVLAVVRAVAQLGLPVHVTGWMCVADNMPSGRAIRPGDVLRALDGTSIEVLNTDAEGRLVLADGLVAASRENPDLLVDVATLTGAILVSLGLRHTGVMGDDDAVAEYLAASERAGELAWHLPLPAHMEEELDSPIADLRNAKIGDTSGGALFAGLFLRRFVGRTGEEADSPRIPWVHLDIAGSGDNDKGAPYGFTGKGPTGASVRALIALIAGEDAA